MKAAKKKSKLSVEAKNEEISRTLYLQLTKNICDEEEIKPYVDNYERIVLHRKASRNCFVIFKNKKDVLQHVKKLKSVENVIARPRKLINLEENKIQKPSRKKINIKEKNEEIPVNKVLLVKNIPWEINASKLKQAFPDCYTLHIFKGNNNHPKRAKLKMKSQDIAMDYITGIQEAPTINGKKLMITSPALLHEKKVMKRKKRRAKKIEMADKET